MGELSDPTSLFRLGILTALWRRPRIAEAVLRHHVALTVPGVQITVCAVRSPEDTDPADDVPGVLYAESPNQPVSDKWNAGMMALQGRRLDAVMIVGSDDMVTAGYVAEACGAILGGSDFARPLGLVFVNTETGEAHRSALPRIGLGRTLSARLLDACNWQPWPPGLTRRLDGGMDRRLKPVHDRRTDAAISVGCIGEDGPVEVVDLKSAVNLWDYDTMNRVRMKGTLDIDALSYLTDHFPLALPLMAAKKTTKKTTTTKAAPKKAPAKKAPTPDPARVQLRAVKNLLPEWTGHSSRVYRGEVFETDKATGATLTRKKLAQAADAEWPPNVKTSRNGSPITH